MGSADMKQDLVRYEMQACVTEQRLDNVLSKTGRVDPRNKSACCHLLEALKEDAREALEEDDRHVFLSSDTLQKELDQLCRELITRVLLRKPIASCDWRRHVACSMYKNLSGSSVSSACIESKEQFLLSDCGCKVYSFFGNAQRCDSENTKV